MENILHQLQQRQIFKVATIYAVSAWPLVQIADLSVPALGLPDSVMTMLLQVFVAGFPITLIFAWLFNFTPDGIVRASSDSHLQGEQPINLKATVAVAGALLIMTTVLFASQYFLDDKNSHVAANLDNMNSELSPPLPPSIGSKNNTENEQLNGKKESIAILPFVVLSSDPEDEYFADGMVEELLNLLAKIPDLQVAARTSSFAFKGVTSKTISAIGKELGVDTILEGSIRKNDTTNKIRVTAQLIKVSTGEHLWSETYDRVYQGIFKIQDEIANAVVNKMKATLLGAAQRFDITAETLNVDAMIEHGKGQKELTHRSVASINKAMIHFKRAVLLDPNYARAHVGVADATILSALYGNTSKEQASENAQQAINKALSIDSQFAAAYATQGLLLSWDDEVKAEQSFKRAIELNPNYAMAYMWYGSLLKQSGKLKGSQALFLKALKLDPKSPITANNVAWGYYLMGDETKAMEIFSQIISNDPFYPGAYTLAGEILTNHGRLDEATDMYNRSLEVDPVNSHAIKGLLTASMDVGDFDATVQWFEYVEKRKIQFSEPYVNLLKARFNLVQGNRKEALRYLDMADFADEDMMSFIEGDKAFYKENYAEAASVYQTLREENRDLEVSFYSIQDGRIAANLGYAYQELGEVEKAKVVIDEFEKYTVNSRITRSNSPSYYMNMAQINALQQNKEEAFYYIQGAIDVGWVRVWEVEQSPVFGWLSQYMQFSQMMGGIKARLATMRNRMHDADEFLLAEAEYL
ncbi:MAG: TolB-like protein/Flp pilus assembly protein TadD [Paraglaciecola sp.]